MITYKGYQIERDEEGLYWKHGGYCAHYAEIECEIDDYIAEEFEHYRDLLIPSDTPSLPDTWKVER